MPRSARTGNACVNWAYRMDLALCRATTFEGVIHFSQRSTGSLVGFVLVNVNDLGLILWRSEMLANVIANRFATGKAQRENS